MVKYIIFLCVTFASVAFAASATAAVGPMVSVVIKTQIGNDGWGKIVARINTQISDAILVPEESLIRGSQGWPDIFNLEVIQNKLISIPIDNNELLKKPTNYCYLTVLVDKDLQTHLGITSIPGSPVYCNLKDNILTLHLANSYKERAK